MPLDQVHFGFKFKWDGYRAICFWDGKKAEFHTRNHKNIIAKAYFI